MSAGNFGHCGDARVCHGLIVGGKTVIDSERNLKGINSIKTKGLSINGCITQPVVVSEDVLAGNVLVVSSTADRQVENSSSSGQETVVGIACTNALAGQTVEMVIGGEFKIRKTGSVDRGDFLATSSNIGTAESTGTDGDEEDFAIATSTANSSVDFVWARFKKSEVY